MKRIPFALQLQNLFAVSAVVAITGLAAFITYNLNPVASEESLSSGSVAGTVTDTKNSQVNLVAGSQNENMMVDNPLSNRSSLTIQLATDLSRLQEDRTFQQLVDLSDPQIAATQSDLLTVTNNSQEIASFYIVASTSEELTSSIQVELITNGSRSTELFGSNPNLHVTKVYIAPNRTASIHSLVTEVIPVDTTVNVAYSIYDVLPQGL